MKTVSKVAITAVFVQYIPEILEESKVYISEEYEVSVHACLCGCGNKTVLPLNANEWQLSVHKNGEISFSPSVSNYQFPCKSHYVIRKNVANFL